MECYDVGARIKVMKEFGDVLRIPRISAEAEDQDSFLRAIDWGDMHAAQDIAVGYPQLELLRSPGQWAGWSDCIDREKQLGLKIDHDCLQCAGNEGHRKQRCGGFPNQRPPLRSPE
jgi:hypothetical protein